MALATPNVSQLREPTRRRQTCKTSRPALIDLRFKGDAWVVAQGPLAVVCLGDFALSLVPAGPFDLQTLNHLFAQVRTGQARRNYMRKVQRLELH
ncbi:MAG: hypothetical protein U0797_16815 [Gemmataceae bacterium]